MLPLSHNYSGEQKKSYKIRCTKNNVILLTGLKFNKSDLTQNDCNEYLWKISSPCKKCIACSSIRHCRFTFLSECSLVVAPLRCV